MYPAEIVLPMKQDLTKVGFEDLTTPAMVDEAVNSKGTTLVVINSVCGCAAGNARPAVKAAVSYDKIPSRITTVFAGFDGDAVLHKILIDARANCVPHLICQWRLQTRRAAI